MPTLRAQETVRPAQPLQVIPAVRIGGEPRQQLTHRARVVPARRGLDHNAKLLRLSGEPSERLRRPQHAHTVGILLCSDKNDSVVRYALAGSQAPIAVSSYDLLPAAEKAALPSEDELTRALAGSRDE